MYEFRSPFTEYLHTNFVPSSIDRAQIQQLLEEPQMETAKLDTEISRLKSQLDEIIQRKARLDEAIHEHHQLMTPFRRLPDDILREIFLWCLPDTNNAIMSALEAPLMLGRVCSRWRTLAYHSPRLWATLHIPLPIAPSREGGLSFYVPNDKYQNMCLEFEEKFQRHCVAVEEWLDRSGNCPLSISVNPRESVPITQSYYVKAYLNILMRYSHRWRSLEVSIPTGEYSNLFSSIADTSVPWLELLHLKFSRRAAHDNVWVRCGILRAKKLRVLHLAQFPYRLSTIQMDWSQITHLILSDANAVRNRRISLDEAYLTFSRCTNLRHCIMDIIDNADTTINLLEDSIYLPYLESLAIIDGARHLPQIIETLHVPSLRDITYHTTFWPSTTRRSPLLLLLQHTNNQVTSLTTDLQFFTHAELVECLELMPFLTHLSNVRSRLGVSRDQARSRAGLPIIMQMMKLVLDVLLPNNDNRCLAPRLQTLHLKESLVIYPVDALRFIKQRLQASQTIPGVERLSAVAIAFAREPAIDIEAELKDYIEGGLKLDLTYPPPRRISPGNFNPFNGLVKWDAGSRTDIMV